jgi:type IV fimbrial biogenesis protein FimT
MTSRRGFTLFELLITLVIVSFALAMAIPPLEKSLQRNIVYADSKELLHLVKLARQSAVFGSIRVVVCAIDSSQRCTRDWSQDLLVFTDSNRNNQLDGQDRIVKRWQQGKRRSKLHWRGFGPGYLRFRQSGAAAENGAFTLCPVDGDIRNARQLVVNRVGRAYISRDRDGDGIADYGDNRRPSCS